MEAEEQKKKITGKTKVSTKIKEKQLRALEELNDRMRLLVALQKNAVQRAQLSDQPVKVHLERLSVYDRFIPLIVTAHENLGESISAKHPGGAPANKFRDFAWDILTDHYIYDGNVPSAKELVRRVAEKLPKGSLDANASGNEPFSNRIAGTVIREFKACLNSDLNYWN